MNVLRLFEILAILFTLAAFLRQNFLVRKQTNEMVSQRVEMQRQTQQMIEQTVHNERPVVVGDPKNKDLIKNIGKGAAFNVWRFVTTVTNTYAYNGVIYGLGSGDSISKQGLSESLIPISHEVFNLYFNGQVGNLENSETVRYNDIYGNCYASQIVNNVYRHYDIKTCIDITNSVICREQHTT